MSRRGTAEEKTAKSDPIYRNRLVNMLVNRILKHGKKIIGLSNYLSSPEKDSTKDRNKSTIRFTSSNTWSNSRYSRCTQGKALSIRWLLGASRKRPGRNMAFKLSSELVDAAKGSGDAIRKKEETHIMAEANRAFAHFC
ncbi:hypothetical protein C5167_009430 [Papaver somniferum]|uniref:Small ribosomal subunit protein uS7 domain-containing protein n=1 Tax=Papaver somniferum TaxID=3469 RepID=A0A4Y7JXC4_PAPSO|nr:hypothetical protein C5167_009430 [Papaver somniferum]